MLAMGRWSSMLVGGARGILGQLLGSESRRGGGLRTGQHLALARGDLATSAALADRVLVFANTKGHFSISQGP
jgi:hypothetical protein